MNLKKIGIVLFLSLFLLAPLMQAHCDQQEPQIWTLWPGESCSCFGIQVTRKVPEKAADLVEAVGRLHFIGPQNEIRDVPLPILLNESRQIIGQDNFFAYLDGVIFSQIRFDSNPRPDQNISELLSKGVRIKANAQPDRFHFGGAPTLWSALAVSNLCPLSLNEWQLTLSDEKAPYPGGMDFHQLIAFHEGTGEKIIFPATPGVNRRFGRFKIQVGDFCEVTRTVLVELQAEADPSVKGKEAYVESFPVDYRDLYSDLLQRLSTEYGFEVEWVEVAGDPRSVTYARNLMNGMSGFNVERRTIEQLVTKLLWHRRERDRKLEFEWTDDTHLRVWAANYEAHLADEKERAEREEHRRRLKESFEADYALLRRIYRPQSISLETAEGLIAPLLDTYYLSLSMREILNSDKMEACWKYDDNKSRSRTIPNLVSEESVLADPKSGTLIVSAIAQTHEKIQDVLQRTDLLLNEQIQADSAHRERYELGIALLRGRSQADTFAIRSPFDGTIVEVLTSGQKVKKDDIVARFDNSSVLQRYEVRKAELADLKLKLENASKQYERRVKESAAGRAPQTEVEEAREKVSSLEVESKNKESEIAELQKSIVALTIRAPLSGKVFTAINQGYVRQDAVLLTLLPDESQDPSETSRQVAEHYGISKEDLERFGLTSVSELGRGGISLIGERGPVGKATLSLAEAYQCELEFLDLRGPYLIVKARLRQVDSGKILIENSLFLEAGKPSVLGLTNLREALILVVRLRGEG